MKSNFQAIHVNVKCKSIRHMYVNMFTYVNICTVYIVYHGLTDWSSQLLNHIFSVFFCFFLLVFFIQLKI